MTGEEAREADGARWLVASLLRQLAGPGAYASKRDGALRVSRPGGACGAPVDPRALAALLRAGWIAPAAGEGGTIFCLTASGRKRALATPAQDPAPPHAVLETRLIGVQNGEPFYATVNTAESPLAWLRSRAGGRYLTETEFQAGETLREDFTRGQMTPRVTVDWTRPMNAGGGRGDAAEHKCASAQAARDRVRRALAEAGPGLADVLLAVCCHLEGLEVTERTLGWPRRSAKLVLKLGLGRLARHYRLEA
jgi:hypothetical protein